MVFKMLLKIIFVLVLIFTGIETNSVIIPDFYQPREVGKLDTWTILTIKLVFDVDMQCRYF